MLQSEEVTVSRGIERRVPLGRALELIDLMRGRFFDCLGTESVDVSAAAGRRLAIGAIAEATSPPYDTCTMDGYALAAGAEYPLRVSGRAFAGEERGAIKPGETVYVTTGARLPAGADAVLRVEDARIEGDLLGGPRLKKGTFVLRAGADFRSGEQLISAGTVLTAPMIGVLQAAAISTVRVYKKISVAVVTTGDEIASGDIRDTNSPMICALLRSWGCQPHHLGPVKDDLSLVREAVKAASYQYDLVITVGGVSAGARDFVKAVAEEGEVQFAGVRLKPGMPFTASYYNGVPLLALPGKPAGSFVGMELFVKRLILGARPGPKIAAQLNCDVTFSAGDYDYLVFAELKDGCACPVGYPGSSLDVLDGQEYSTSLISAASRSLLADGYFIARDNLRAGDTVGIMLIL